MRKSQCVHFRKRSTTITTVNFHVGAKMLDKVGSYKYLGLVLTEYLDFKVTAECVAKSASRALGILITKSKLTRINNG